MRCARVGIDENTTELRHERRTVPDASHYDPERQTSSSLKLQRAWRKFALRSSSNASWEPHLDRNGNALE